MTGFRSGFSVSHSERGVVQDTYQVDEFGGWNVSDGTVHVHERLYGGAKTAGNVDSVHRYLSFSQGTWYIIHRNKYVF